MGKKPRNTKPSGKKQQYPEPHIKDDGHLYRVINSQTGRPIYLGEGVKLGVAEQMSDNLYTATHVERVD